ncbi:hypothetical protein F53441_9467 [Fusarium austroafricanum]|uniref:Uncharacterized protein n=1 Tax=Fusarium austroafricanum TaxID=2364996 RepID=A0A8H4KBQ1_9HYPO|nr:hypothetical protein F53441_9467 [Fusarium austroafricanum]
MSTNSPGDIVQAPSGEISRTGSSFQVTIDAGGAASGMVNFSMSVLGRLSQAGIDPGTFTWAVLVGEHIDWSQSGSERYYSALRDAPVQNGFNNILWFGFGHKSPIQILSSTESSSRFTAVCACLTEVYSTHMAAQIMLALSRVILENTPHPRPPLPSLLQMHLLVEKCAGIFSSTAFSLRAEKFMSFDGEKVIGQHAWPRAVGKARYSRGVSKPEDIAQALYGLVQLSKRSLRDLTLVGVADAGLIAAVGDWLFDFNIAIFVGDDDSGDRLRFRNMDEESEPQLTIIYTRGDAGTSLAQHGRTVHLSDATLLFKSHAQRRPNQDRVLGGRVHWRGAFDGTFGEDFKRLLRIPALFGTAIGSAARIFTGLVNADENLPENWLRRNTIYFPDSFGRNFVEFALYRFPELDSRPLKTEMVNAVRIKTYEEASAEFEGSMSRLANICGCKICSPSNYQPDEAEIGHHVGTRRSPQQYCMVVIAATVIRLVRTLSGINPIHGLHPMRAGIEYIYEITQTRIWRLSRQDKKNILPIICSIIEGGTSDLKWTEVSLLRFAHHVFGGQTFHDENDDPGCSATVFEGICCYLDILRSPKQDDPMALARVNVLPGHIEWQGRLFHKLGEKSTSLFDATSFVQSRPKDCVPSRVMNAIESCSGGSLELILTESISRDRRALLEVDYEVEDRTGGRHRLGPAIAVRSICRSSGLVTCLNDGCQLSQAIAQDVAVKLGQKSSTTTVCQVMINNSTVTIFDGGQIALLIAAFGCWEPLIQRGECLACCVRTGCSNGWYSFAIVRTNLSRRTAGHHLLEE